MRAIIDANIIVSGLLTKGTCRKLLLSLKNKDFILVISEEILEEIEFVLNRKKFSLLINKDEKEDILSFIKTQALFFKPKTKINICRDEKDNIILETALTAKADIIVTGDKDLLVLTPFKGIPIITAKEFTARLEK